ncbi:hypothetical protein [Leifsonia shinshuensis]|uniref:hypothetical protein n=1 Tax=Leifsonia shinshuensis TaxID=150026 RepID=UPI002861F665|nr:hypothetical protein [Leifsonia shinshuensis]MDR6973169.1 hypothetical protein [Leifsonia shinshuensis]
MTSYIICGGAGFLMLVAAGVAIILRLAKVTLRKQVLAISGRFPQALSTSAQGALVTYWALRRIAAVDRSPYGRTGSVYSLVASRGHLTIVRGREAKVLADFTAEQVADVRVDTTSVLLADYTTLFFGIRAGDRTFELPVRVNGPMATSLRTASTEWAKARGDAIVKTVRGESVGT